MTECSHCGKKYARKSSLALHIEKHHTLTVRKRNPSLPLTIKEKMIVQKKESGEDA